jgi:metal-responsive CopG/Arc/MetJ family transcriptional regulator
MKEKSKIKKSITVRIDIEILDSIDQICTAEAEKIGYDVDRSDIVRKALMEFITHYYSNDKTGKTKKNK